jgi:polyhydroxyalkanoate synthesis regulator phasin
MTFFDAVRNALLAGFGVQEKVAEFINDLVKKGELSESQGAKLVREWTDKADKSTEQLSKSLSDIISKTMEKMAIPTRGDIEQMNKKIQALSARLKKLEGISSESARGEEEGPEEE